MLRRIIASEFVRRGFGHVVRAAIFRLEGEPEVVRAFLAIYHLGLPPYCSRLTTRSMLLSASLPPC